MSDAQRASWLAFLSLAAAWVAGMSGLALLPLSASAFALAQSGAAAPGAALLVGWLAAGLATAALAYAAVAAVVAQGLWRGRVWARGGALGLAVANLFLPPFGTAHGAYALWLLLSAPGTADDTHEVTHAND